MKRKVLIILSNRLNRNQKARFIELDCDEEGNILKSTRCAASHVSRATTKSGRTTTAKTDFASCHSFKRKYGHALESPKPGRQTLALDS